MSSRTRTLLSVVATGAMVVTAGAYVTSQPQPGPIAAVHAGDESATHNPVGMAEWMYEQRIYPERRMPYDAVAAAITQSGEMSDQLLASDAAEAARWKLTGPTNIGGRIRELAADPTNRNHVYAAAATGGIWKSTDAGQTFESVWPDDWVQSMGAVAVDENGVVWVGTGEPDMGGGSAYYGDGVYKSTDGGKTWDKVGLESSGSTGTIAIDPENPDRVFVAVQGRLHDTDGQRGLYRTEDGGESWTRVLKGEEDDRKDSVGAIDVAISPHNSDVVLVTMWDKIRAQDGRIYGKGSKLYRSTDGGESWTDEQQEPLPISFDDESQPISATYVGRMGIAFSKTEEGRVYLISSTAGGNFNGFFTSENNGRDWEAVGATTGGPLQTISGGFAWWFGRVWVDPKDEDHVFVAGVQLAESTNGGQTWQLNGAVHADQHAMDWDPFRDDRVYLGNDGGFYRNDQNGGSSTPWFKTPQMGITQFYAMDSSEQNVKRLNAGTQDNNSLKSWQADGSVTGEWVPYVGGDGMMNRIDPEDHDYYYGCSQNGGCRAFTPFGSFGITIPGARKNWVAPLEFRNSNTKVMYSGSEYMNRMEVRQGGMTWTKISDDLTGGPTPRSAGFGTITAIGSGYNRDGLVYAGTDDGRLWRSKNADAANPADVEWKRLRDKDALPKRWVTRVEVSPHKDKWTAASFSAWRWLDGEDSPHVSITKNAGKDWKDISGNLPDAPVNDVIWHPKDKKTLFVATDVGVFTTTDLGKSWKKVGANLPLVPIHDVNIQIESMTLFAATYGRSIWETKIS